MATETITICYCDICGKEGAKSYRTIGYRTFDGNDGRTRIDPPDIESIRLDLCYECARRAAVIHCVGVCTEKFTFD